MLLDSLGEVTRDTDIKNSVSGVCQNVYISFSFHDRGISVKDIRRLLRSQTPSQ